MACHDHKALTPLLRLVVDSLYKLFLRSCKCLRACAAAQLRVKANSHRHTRHDTYRTVLSRPLWLCELNRPDRPTSAFSVGVCRAAQALPVRPPDALRTQNAPVGRSGRVNSHHLTLHSQNCLVVSGGRCELTGQHKSSCNVCRSVADRAAELGAEPRRHNARDNRPATSRRAPLPRLAAPARRPRDRRQQVPRSRPVHRRRLTVRTQAGARRRSRGQQTSHPARHCPAVKKLLVSRLPSVRHARLVTMIETPASTKCPSSVESL